MISKISVLLGVCFYTATPFAQVDSLNPSGSDTIQAPPFAETYDLSGTWEDSIQDFLPEDTSSMIPLKSLTMREVVDFESSAERVPGSGGSVFDKEPTLQDYAEVAASRFSFVLGVGFSGSTSKYFRQPVVDASSKAVILEEAYIFRPNMSLGIQYTPVLFSRTEKIKYIEGGEVKEKKFISNGAQGISVCTFLSPSLFSDMAAISLSSPIDVGFGIGYRTTNFALFITTEFTAIRQPRDYFVKNYEGNDLPYKVDGEIQASINPDNNQIFRDQTLVSVGLKLAYTFDVIQAFKSKVPDEDSPQ